MRSLFLKTKCFNLLAVLLLLCASAKCANVDTVSIYSNGMHNAYKCVVITPQKHKGEKGQRWPVVYLLHGYGGWYANWILRVPELTSYADQYRMIIVCPDGATNSWYVDSPMDSSIRYETYIAREVPAYIDAHYPTIANRTARAITGLSMGGHGGLMLGLRHADFFGACGSMSGAVELESITRKYELMKRLGDTITHAANWKAVSVMDMVEHYPSDTLAMIIDCGNDDIFITVNRALHAKLLQLKIPHDYIERPGKHEWPYWKNAVAYQLLFFRRYFDRQQPK